MKNTLFKSLVLLMGMVMSTAFVACGNDDDESDTPKPSKEVASYEITYMAEVSQGYLDYYDVTWSYVDSNGETKTEALTEKKSFSINVPANVMPSEAGLTIHGKLKNPMPGYDEETVYEFGYSYQLLVNCNYTDKTTEIVGGNIIPNSYNLPVKGNKLTNYFDKHTNFDIVSNTVNVK